MGNSSSACDNYEKSLKYGGSAAGAAINNLARLKILQGNSAEAVQMIKAVLLDIQDNSKVKASLYKNLGWAYFEQKLYKQAQKYLLMLAEIPSVISLGVNLLILRFLKKFVKHTLHTNIFAI